MEGASGEPSRGCARLCVVDAVVDFLTVGVAAAEGDEDEVGQAAGGASEPAAVVDVVAAVEDDGFCHAGIVA